LSSGHECIGILGFGTRAPFGQRRLFPFFGWLFLRRWIPKTRRKNEVIEAKVKECAPCLVLAAYLLRREVAVSSEMCSLCQRNDSVYFKFEYVEASVSRYQARILKRGARPARTSREVFLEH